MLKKNKVFKLFDRIFILHLFDSFFILVSLYVFGAFFEITYLIELAVNFKNVFLFICYLSFFGSVFELYDIQVANDEFKVLRSITLTVSSTVLFYILTPVLSPVLPENRLQILAFFAIFFITLCIWRFVYIKYLSFNLHSQNVVLVCDENEATSLISDFENLDPHYRIIGCFSVFENEFQLHPLFFTSIKDEKLSLFIKKNEVTEIIIASKKITELPPKLFHELLKLLESGVVIREYQEVYESKYQRIPLNFIGGDLNRCFPFSKNYNSVLYLSIVGLFDFVFSLVGLVFGLLLLPFICVGNFFGNRGPLFYTQTRIGKNGLPFEILKLRTMVKNAEANGAVFATSNDSRITVFGKFLRKTRIDEMPQFLNILKGEMAIIGPRPERPEIVSQILLKMPIYETRHVVKPGLTGWAQVNYSYGENIDDSLIKLQYDLYYIKNRNIHLDLSIAIKTITTILFYRGQ